MKHMQLDDEFFFQHCNTKMEFDRQFSKYGVPMTKKQFVTCSSCGKRVSNDLYTESEQDLIVRAWVECPECLVSRSPEYTMQRIADLENSMDDNEGASATAGE